MPLKLAGEMQPMFQAYWETMIEPHIDGRQVEFVGEATPDIKNELLANATALLFPIQWNEPFGLVMIEAMACGTPVLALPGGAVEEIVADGVSGWICANVGEMAQRARDLRIPAASCRGLRGGAILGGPNGRRLRETLSGASWTRPTSRAPREHRP